MPDDTGLAEARPEALLALYATILDELRDRGIVRSTNNPVGDYAEYLVATALGLRLVDNATSGFDAIGADDQLYQIKARRLTPRNPSRQLGFIRGLDAPGDPFDLMAAVLFEADFGVMRAVLVPVEVVRARAVRVDSVNAWRMMLTDAVWHIEGVQDITARIRAAAEGPTVVPPVIHAARTEPSNAGPKPSANSSVSVRTRPDARPQTAVGNGRRPKTQREVMQELYVASGHDEVLTVERYADAERQGLIQRQRNTHGTSPEWYAKALFADGIKKGWLLRPPGGS
jgi:hypothetical protein